MYNTNYITIVFSSLFFSVNAFNPIDSHHEDYAEDLPCTHNKFYCGSEMCIERVWVCDGDVDCPNGQDEKGCPHHCDEETNYACLSEGCIPLSWKCDGSVDCADGTDELFCDSNWLPTTAASYTCPEDEFMCPDGISCVKKTWVCDGADDCPDGGDESVEICGHDTTCTTFEFRCKKSGTCVPRSFRCDGVPNCEDHSDEEDCELDKCDIPGACSHICVVEKEKVKCDCLEGYIQDPKDGTRCLAKPGRGSLLYSRKHGIRKINLEVEEISSVVNDSKSVIALDYDYKLGLIFWSDTGDKKIYKSHLDSKEQITAVVNNEIVQSDGLAVDWIYKRIYWTDTGKNTIEMANYDGSMKKTIIESSLDEPRAIVLDPLDGWMYWSDWGKEPCIERAWLNGSHRRKIIIHGVKWPNGLALDLVKQRLYWVDAKLNSISSSDYDGSSIVVVLRSYETLFHPFSITVFEDNMYWSDWECKSIFKANKFNGKNATSITSSLVHHPNVVHVYHPYRQPEGINLCEKARMECTHLCFPTPRRYWNVSHVATCSCPDGFVLQNDSISCLHPDSEGHLVNMTRTTPEKNDNSIILLSIIISTVFIVVIILSFGFFIAYHRCFKMTDHGTNYNNPVYRKTTDEGSPTIEQVTI